MLDGTAVEKVTELKVLGVVLDTKMYFGSHIRLIAAYASSKLGNMRKALCLFGDPVLVSRCFWSFLLPVFKYCCLVWMSATASLRLFDCVVSKIMRLSDGLVGSVRLGA